MIRFLLILILALSTSTISLASSDIDPIGVLESRLQAQTLEFEGKDLNDIEVVKSQVLAMYQLDQDTRALFQSNSTNERLIQFMGQMDSSHTEHIKKILPLHDGWLTISKFGKKTDGHLWALVQHADHDYHFQYACLTRIASLLESAETHKLNFCYLYDRIAVNSGKRQYYGTQLELKEGKVSPYPYEGALAELDSRRAKVGLDPISTYIQRFAKQ